MIGIHSTIITAMIGVEEHEQGVEDKNEGDFTTKIGWFVKQMRQSVIHKITREIYTSV